MDFETAKCVFMEAMKLPYLHSEDVFITGFGGQACHTKLINSPLVLHAVNVNRTDYVLMHKAQHYRQEEIFYNIMEQNTGIRPRNK